MLGHLPLGPWPTLSAWRQIPVAFYVCGKSAFPSVAPNFRLSGVIRDNPGDIMEARKILGVFSLSMVLGLPHAMNAEGGASNVKYCTNSDPNCGLSGIDRSVLRDSLFKGLKDLPFGLGGRGIGFPADVLAAAYNMNDQQHEF